jgi:glycosyltransferase involved in cell wall biosynthesis
MKIKYIGNFNDGTGWAKASTYNALALHAAGHDVYCQEVKYGRNTSVLNDTILQLIDKKTDDSYDMIINHLIPNDYQYINGVKNVGIVELETITLANVTWLKNIDLMDEIYVPNKASKDCLVSSHIHPDKIKIFNHMIDYAKIQNNSSKVYVEELKNTFNFVFAGEYSKRKNVEAVLRAFHTEFHYIEPVNLYIKTDNDMRVINEFKEKVYDRLRLRNRYKKEIIISEYLNEQDMWSTFKQCHAFVMPSYGEAWCYPAMEAMAMGIPAIYTKGIGIEDYAPKNANFAVESTVQPCYGATNAHFSDIYTSHDRWLEVDILDLQKKMRDVFELYRNNRDQYDNIVNINKEAMSKYDFNNTDIVRNVI